MQKVFVTDVVDVEVGTVVPEASVPETGLVVNCPRPPRQRRLVSDRNNYPP